MSDEKANAADRPPGKLVSDLIGAHHGPILVVGGGIHVPEEMAYLREHNAVPSFVISANGHAFKAGLQADYIVCKDEAHTETKERMEDLLRPHGVPIISPQPWGDYVMRDWPYQGNSGLHAILVVIPIGFDFYQDGTYWYDPEAPNVSRGRAGRSEQSRVESLARLSAGASIRPLTGPLLRAFPRFTPWGVLPARKTPEVVNHYVLYGRETRRERDRRLMKRFIGA
jgi:hypothetical protein